MTRRFVFRDVIKNPQKFAETARSLDWSEVEMALPQKSFLTQNPRNLNGLTQKVMCGGVCDE